MLQKMQVVALDKNEYGHFHTGDSYILLYVSCSCNFERNAKVHPPKRSSFFVCRKTKDIRNTTFIFGLEKPHRGYGNQVLYSYIRTHRVNVHLKGSKCVTSS